MVNDLLIIIDNCFKPALSLRSAITTIIKKITIKPDKRELVKVTKNLASRNYSGELGESRAPAIALAISSLMAESATQNYSDTQTTIARGL